MLRNLAARLFVPLFVAGLAAAQEIKVPDGPLQVGKTIDIAVNDPSRANGSIVVTIENSDPSNSEKLEVEIKLDASGNGVAQWTVPDWVGAAFNAPGCKEVTRAIDEGEPTSEIGRATSGQRASILVSRRQ
jgi:hypothetical protein